METTDPTVPPEEDSPPAETPVPPPPPAPRFLGPWRAIILLLGIMFLYMLGEAAVLVGSDSFAFIAGLSAFATQMLNMAPIAILALVALKLPPRESLGLQKPSSSLLLMVAGFAICNMLFMIKGNTLFSELAFTSTDMFEQVREMMGFFGGADTPVETFFFFCLMIIGAPVAEELFFRGFLQNVLVRVWKPWVGVLVTTIIFTLIHWHPIRFFMVFELGLILGLLYHRTGSLALVIAFHAASNLVGFSIMNNEQWGLWSQTQTAFAVGVAGTLVFGFLLLREVGAMPRPDRSLRPGRMRWFFVLFRMIPAWIVAVALVFVSSFFASDGARELKKNATAMTLSTGKITNRFETMAGMLQFFDALSEARGAIKQGHATTADMTTFLDDAEKKIDSEAPSATITTEDGELGSKSKPRPKSAEETPLPWERNYLTWVREQVKERFDVEIPPPEYDD